MKGLAFGIAIEAIDQSRNQRNSPVELPTSLSKARAPMSLVGWEAQSPKPKRDVLDPVLFLEERSRRPDLGAGPLRIQHHAAAILGRHESPTPNADSSIRAPDFPAPSNWERQNGLEL
jgi:hypothetical protein